MMKNKIFVTLCMFTTFSFFHCQKLHFKDKNFEKAMIESYDFDFNKDRMIDKVEASKVVQLFLTQKNITLIDDLQLFPNLKMVLLDDNTIPVIHLKNLRQLELFSCTGCKASVFKGENLEGLTSLYLDNNLLESFSLKAASRIDQLTLSLNKLKWIDIIQLKSLRKLNLEHNQIKKLDLSGNSALQTLNVGGNAIVKSDIRGINSNMIIFGVE